MHTGNSRPFEWCIVIIVTASSFPESDAFESTLEFDSIILSTYLIKDVNPILTPASNLCAKEIKDKIC